jgi:CRISPR-associated endonuclease/helicase Cas3
VLLLKWVNSTLQFFSSDREFPEDLSQVSISETKISAEYPHTGEMATKLEKFKATLPDKGRWRVIIPLTEENNQWHGKALDKHSREVFVKYNSKLGLQMN